MSGPVKVPSREISVTISASMPASANRGSDVEEPLARPLDPAPHRHLA